MISKELFIKVIQSIQLQLAEDKKNAEIVAEIFGSTEFNLYNNEKLIVSLIDVLAIWFERSEIEHYIFDLNFGKPNSDSECETFGEFYDRISK